MSDLEKKVRAAVEEWGAVDTRVGYIVGVSGGTDSLALAHLLHRFGIPIIIAHFNHQMRSKAGEDQKFVEKFAKRLSVDFVTDAADIHSIAVERSWTIEQAARVLRYQFLFRVADSRGSSGVVVGHTANDQIETVLLNLARGAGLDGLCGMDAISKAEWHPDIPLLRPMLSVWREELDAYSRTQKLMPRFDESNLSTEYSRNYVRHEIVPRFEVVNSGAQQAILRMIEVLRFERETIDRCVDDAWEKVVRVEGEVLWIDRELSLSLLPGIRNRLLRRAMGILIGSTQDLSYSHIQALDNAIMHVPKSGEMHLGDKAVLLHEAGQIRLSAPGIGTAPSDGPQICESGIKVDAPGDYALGGGWVVSLQILDRDEVVIEEVESNQDRNVALVDSGAVKLPLLIRGRKEGDRFSPLGMSGQSMKVSDYLINVKLPNRLRDCWPLVVSGGEIVWAVGFQIGDRFRVGPNSHKLLEIRLMGPD